MAAARLASSILAEGFSVGLVGAFSGAFSTSLSAGFSTIFSTVFALTGSAARATSLLAIISGSGLADGCSSFFSADAAANLGANGFSP